MATPHTLFAPRVDLDSPTPVGSDRETCRAQLGETIAALAARLQAATYELLVLLRQFDEGAGWNAGFRSCAHWLHWRTGIDLGAAREKVRVARALAKLPLISAAMRNGELSYAKVRALTRVTTRDNERQLLDVALAGTATHVEQIVRAWRRADRIEAAQMTERRYQARQVSMWVDEDGMVILRAHLPPEIGAIVQRALEAAADQLCALTAGLDRGTAGDRYQVVVHVDTTAMGTNTTSSGTDAGQTSVELDDGAVWCGQSTCSGEEGMTLLQRLD